MATYTRMTVQGTVTGRYAALVDAAADILDSMAPANVVTLVARQRQARVSDLVAALTLDYDVEVPA